MHSRLPLAVLLAAPLLAGCSAARLHQRADVLDYLYPADKPAEPARDVHLELPLHVGIAFVPASGGREGTITLPTFWEGDGAPLPPTMEETQRATLLGRVREAFAELGGVERIEVVPSEFLRPGGGFEELDRLRTMFGLDLIALVSYEQTQHGDLDESSLAYWTLVGTVFVSGNENETVTFVNASVIDIASRALLFQASGTSSISDQSTLFELNQELRDDSQSGFSRAVDAMIGELDGALARFKEQVETGTVRGAGTPALTVSARPGYEGAGAAGWLEIATGLALGGAAAARRRRSEA